MRGYIIKVLLIFLSFIVALVVSEAMLRIINPLPEFAELFRPKPIKSIGGNEKAVRKDRKLGWRLKSNLEMQFKLKNSYDVTVITNSKGIRDKREFNYKKKPDVLRILSIGDSFTWGTGVENREAWPARLEHYINSKGLKAEVINMGVGGFGTDQSYLYYTTEGVKYNADIVVIGYGPWLMRRNNTNFFIAPKPRFIRKGETIILDKMTPDMKIPKMDKFLTHFYLYRYLWHTIHTYKIIPSYLGYGEGNKITKLIFKNLIKEIKSNGAYPIIVYIPREQEIKSNFSYILSMHEKSFVNFIGKENAVIINMTPIFRSKKGISLYLENEMGHTNKNGHDLIGLNVADHIFGEYQKEWRNNLKPAETSE